MTPNLRHRSAAAFEAMTPREVAGLLASARVLQQACLAGTTQPLLRGKNFGLLCEAADEGQAEVFRHAVLELGAHAAHIRPSLSELSTALEVQHTARMLGRLYDAVECQGMAPALVQQVGDAAGVPVFDGIATREHPTARLAELLGGASALVDARRFVLQAVLLSLLS